MTREEKSWILYDVGNSAFILIVTTTVMPIFFKDVASSGVPGAVSTANWGFANSFSSLVLALLAPVLGTLADYPGRKKRFFSTFLFVGILCTLLLTTVDPGDWLICLVLYAVARIGYSGANLFYDASLVDVTDRKRMDWISSSGYAWGYLGSVVPFVAVMMVIAWYPKDAGGGAISEAPAKIAFAVAAFWWMLFSIPLLKNVGQKYHVEPSGHPVKESFIRLLDTFREIRRYRQAFIFLIAYFFYIDGVDTVITMATSFGRDMGLGVSTMILAVLMIQVAAFPFAILYGKMAQRFGTKTMLYAGIGVYLVITLVAFFLPQLGSHGMKTAAFYVLSFLVATSMGGIQALSRSFFSRLIPAERSGEFFGFYNIFGKFAAILGPALMGSFGRITGETRYGVLSILILFAAGGWLLRKVKAEEDV